MNERDMDARTPGQSIEDATGGGAAADNGAFHLL
jgi:hypothetical protein